MDVLILISIMFWTAGLLTIVLGARQDDYCVKRHGWIILAIALIVTVFYAISSYVVN